MIYNALSRNRFNSDSRSPIRCYVTSLMIFCLLVTLPLAFVDAQDSGSSSDPISPVIQTPGTVVQAEKGRENDTTADSETASTILPLPPKLSDGRDLRPVALFLSQMDVLVSKDYMPVSLEQLRTALLNQRIEVGESLSTQPVASEYIVDFQDNQLVCRRGLLRLPPNTKGELLAPLGMQSVAIRSVQGRSVFGSDSGLPRLEYDTNGQAYAVLDPTDSTSVSFDYQWVCRGKTSGNTTLFRLELPIVQQSKLFLAVPTQKRVLVTNAVGRQVDKVPQEIEGLSQVDEPIWYEIDAGGVGALRLELIDLTDESSREPILRRKQLQCEIDSEGMAWTSRFVFESLSGLEAPELLLQKSDVVSVKLDSEDVPFRLIEEDNGGWRLNMQMPNTNTPDNTELSTLTVAGFSTAIREDSWIELPSVQVDKIFDATTTEEIQLAISEPFSLVDWQLPKTWKSIARETLDSGVTLLRASGSPRYQRNRATNLSDTQQNSNIAGVAAEDVLDRRQESLTQVMLARTPAERLSNVSLRLDVGPSSIDAKARLVIELDSSRGLPVGLQVEDQWELNSLRVAGSNRQISIPTIRSNPNNFYIWPEAGEIEQGRIELIAEGKRRITLRQGKVEIPEGWFVQPMQKGQCQLLASLTPSSNLTWSGEEALEESRVLEPLLDEKQTEFFGFKNARTLWFQPTTGKVPGVTLVRPSVAYTTKSHLFLGYQDGELIEELHLSLQSQSQAVSSLVIQTGGDGTLPAFQWSIRNQGGLGAVQLNNVGRSTGESGEVYEVDFDNISLGERSIVARRSIPLSSSHEVYLPSVLGAASQDADVYLHPSFEILNRSDAVSVVPSIQVTGSASNSDHEKLFTDITSDRWVRLRYDAVEQPSIRIRVDQRERDINVVWNEQVRLISSVMGADQLNAKYHFYSAAPIGIISPPDFKLISVSIGDKKLDVSAWPSGEVRLSPTFTEETVTVRWERFESTGNLFKRTCEVPALQLEGAAVLSSQYELMISPDSFAPDFSPFKLFRDFEFGKLQAGQTFLLLRYEHVLAFGCLAAFVIFGIGWHLVQRSMLAAVSVIFFSVAFGLSVFSWSTVCFAWIVVPMISGVLLSVVCKSFDTMESIDHLSVSADTRKYESADHNQDFSLTDSVKIILMPLAFSLFTSNQINAQETNPSGPAMSDAAVDVLVPVDSKGKQAGNMVYIPRELFADLFSTQSNELISVARFLSGNYRVQIGTVGSDPDKRPAFEQVEAEYLIRCEKKTRDRSLSLPIRFDLVRRIELIDEITRVIPFDRDGDTVLLKSVPAAEIFKIKVTMKPTVSSQGSWAQMELPIPQVGNSKITIESAIPLDAVRLGGNEGWLVTEEGNLSRTWTDEIGPADLLQLDVRQMRDSSINEGKALGRRYWIRSGESEVVIDCELDVPEKLAAGEDFQFVVLDSKMPRIAGDSWHLVGSELYSPSRRLVTVRSLKDQPKPIQLVWTVETNWKPAAFDFTTAIKVPQVIAAAMGENLDPWFAIQTDPSIQLVPLLDISMEPLAVDQFLASWVGYRGTIDRAFVPVQDFPDLQFRRAGDSDVTEITTQYYHAHLKQDQTLLHYRAILSGDESTNPFPKLFIENGVQLTRLEVDGRAQVLTSNTVHGGTDYYLGTLLDRGSRQVDVFGSLPVNADRPFRLPEISFVTSSDESELRGLLTRDPSVQVSSQAEPEVEFVKNAEIDDVLKTWLPKNGRIVGSWYQPINDESINQQLFEREVLIRPISRLPVADQLVVISRKDRRWEMSAFLNFINEKPDTLSIEIPAAWSSEITISGGSILGVLPAIDDAFNVLRIAVDEDLVEGEGVSIQSKVVNVGVNRISVPRLKMLGVRTRKVFLGVPDSIDGQTTQWRTSAVDITGLPKEFIQAPQVDDHVFYRAANASYSIDLAQVAEIELQPVAFCCDTHVFRQQEGLLVFMHWDLYPSVNQSAVIDLPEQSQLVAAWTAGQAVLSSDVPGESRSSITIPFSLDRYSQTIQLLIRIDSSSQLANLDLPVLRDIAVESHWLSVYSQTDTSRDSLDSEMSGTQAERLFSLAESVVESIDAVVDASQYEDTELQTWLHAWVLRYLAIAESAGYDRNRLQAQLNSGSNLNDGERQTTGWENLNFQMSEKLRELPYAVPVESSSDPKKSMFPIVGFDGYQVDRVWEVQNENPSSILRKHLSRHGGITLPFRPFFALMLFGLVVVLVRRHNDFLLPVFENPAFWLLILGLSCWVIFPVPIAATIALIALILPLTSSSKRLKWLIARLRW